MSRQAGLKPSLASLLGILIALSGCTSADQAEPDALASPADLKPPTWTAGDSWQYVNDEGHWRNWTVVGLVERDGYNVYEVDIQYSHPTDVFATTEATMWVDQASFGMKEWKEDDGHGIESDPPMHQLFPMINRTYDVQMTISPHDATADLRHQSEVRGWTTKDTPAGPFEVIEIAIHTEGWDSPPELIWFSPAVGNLVEYEVEGVFRLHSWS